jgi:hypothetical protein
MRSLPHDRVRGKPVADPGPRPTDPRAAAYEALEGGLSVVPPREDGSKAPDGEWKRFQQTRPTSADLDRWYGKGETPNRTGLGIVCGAVSGNQVSLDVPLIPGVTVGGGLPAVTGGIHPRAMPRRNAVHF